MGAQVFTSQKKLTKLAAPWPTARLAGTWNGFAGTPGFDDLKPVKKFTDRKVAISRTWQAIQTLAPAAAPEPTTKKRAKKAIRPAKDAKDAKPKAAPKDGAS